MNTNNIKIRKVLITPEMASEILGKNNRNRPVTITHVKRLAETIEKGEWVFNSESIKIGIDGNLIDGQHRLMAIVKAGIPIESLVVEQLDNEIFHTLDSGKKRSNADTLTTKGYANAKNLAALCGLVYKYETKGTFYKGHNIVLTGSNMMKLLEIFPELVEYASFGTSFNKVKRLPVTACAFTKWLLDRTYKERQDHKKGSKVDTFFELLKTGEGLSKNDPILKLRDFFLTRDTKNSFVFSEQFVFYIIKAWNLWIQNKKLINFKSLEIQVNEKFPIII